MRRLRSYACWIAHVSNPQAPNLEFHLNIPGGDKIPRPGQKVFASSDNGMTGTYRTIKEVVGVRRFPGNGPLTGLPFIAIDYTAE
jgi:hypothetical protein